MPTDDLDFTSALGAKDKEIIALRDELNAQRQESSADQHILLICFLFLVLVSWELCLRSHCKLAGIVVVGRRRHGGKRKSSLSSYLVKNAAFVFVLAIHRALLGWWLKKPPVIICMSKLPSFAQDCSNPSGTATAQAFERSTKP